MYSSIFESFLFYYRLPELEVNRCPSGKIYPVISSIIGMSLFERILSRMCRVYRLAKQLDSYLAYWVDLAVYGGLNYANFVSKYE